MIGDDHNADRCDSCGLKLIDTTAHYVGTTDRKRFCLWCCECAWRSYA